MTGLLWASAALLLAAAGLALWHSAQRQEHMLKVGQRLQKILDLQPADIIEPVQMQAAKDQGWWELLPAWLRFGFSERQLQIIATVVAIVAVLVAVVSMWWVALLLVLMAVSSVCFVGWMRWQKLRADMVRQLPSFIDSMVRMVVLGHASSSAFVMAAASAKSPLDRVVSQAATLAQAGMPVDQALTTASRVYRVPEFYLLSAVIQVGARFGGRVDNLLERVAHYMRDKEEAGRELRALSAEVRVSAWVLCLLPLLVGGFIITTNAAYFLKMWDDPTGRWIAYFGIGLQMLGSLILYRMAKIDD